MGCPPKRRLRAYLDNRMSDEEQRVAGLSANADVVQTHLDALTPATEPDVERAWARSVSLRHRGARTAHEGGMGMKRSFFQRPAFSVGLVILLLAGLLSLSEGRALARQLLSVFRVQRFAVVQVSPDRAYVEDVAQQIEDTLFTSEKQVDEPERTPVASFEEAVALAGFEAREPRYLPGEQGVRYTVEAPARFAVGIRAEGLRLLLQAAEMDPNLIPGDFVEGEVAVNSSGAIIITGEDYRIAQYPDLSAEYPDAVNPAVMIEAGLRVLGMPPEEAQRISGTFDWSSTLLVPVLANAHQVRQTEIAGTDVLILRSNTTEESVFNYGALVMEKDGVLYIIEGTAGTERFTQIAQSMF